MAWQKEEPKNLIVETRNGGATVALMFDPAERLGPSASGKTTIVAKGTIEIPGQPGMVASVTVWVK